MAVLLAGGFVAAWGAGSFGYFLYLEHRLGFAAVEYLNLALPQRWPRHRIALGDFHVARAGACVDRHEYHQAISLLRAGLARSPANVRGRLLLADLFLAARRPDLAVPTLTDGLKFIPANPDYVRATLGLLLEQQQDARLLEIAAPLLSPGNAGASVQKLTALFAARAEYQLGRPARVAELIRRHALSGHPEAVALLARLDWDGGYRELAILRLQEHCRPSGADGPAHTQLAAFLRELGRWDDLQTLYVQRLAAAPLAFAPRIELLHLHHHRGDTARVDRDAAACFANFSRDPAALLMLADFAASTGRPHLAQQALDHATRLPLPDGNFRLMLAEAHLTARDYQTALDHLTGLAKAGAPATRPRSVLSGLQAIACFGLGLPDEARRHLTALLAQPHPRPDNLLAIARRLQATGQPRPAREVLARIALREPPHQPALDALVRLDLETGAIADLPGHLDRLLKTRRPPRDTLLLATKELGGDRHLFLPGQAALLASLRAALAAPGASP